MPEENAKGVFDALERLASNAMLSAVVHQPVGQVQLIQSVIKDQLEKALPYLGSSILQGLDRPLPWWGTSWSPLSGETWVRKKHEEFARETGDSARELLSLKGRAAEIFGEPKAFAQVTVSTPNGVVMSYQVDSRGRWRYSRGMRLDGQSVGGRFVKTIPEMQKVKVGVSFVLPEGVGGDAMSRLLGKLSKVRGSSEYSALQLFDEGRKGEKQPSRPLFAPALNYFLGPALRQRLKKEAGLNL